MKTRVTELLGIEYPVIQGGMAWVAEHHLAAAVSNAGGLGIIGAASMPWEMVREEIRKCKALTDRPFGVNVMLLNPNAEDVARVVVEEGVRVVTTGAGNPAKFMGLWKEAGVKVIPVVASVAMAKLMERAGADAVVAEGMESGGHIGSTTTFALVPQVADAVKIPEVNIPLLAKGGFVTGEGQAIVGEAGAELLTLPKGATVQPLGNNGIDYDKLTQAFVSALRTVAPEFATNVKAVVDKDGLVRFLVEENRSNMYMYGKGLFET